MALLGAWNRLQSAIFGLAIGRAISNALRPTFELTEQEAWLGNQVRVLPLGQIAELRAKAIVPPDAARIEAARSGFNANRLEALTQLALTTPTPSEALTMLRRGLITEDQFKHVLRKAGLEPQYDDATLRLIEALAPISDLIRMAVREAFSPTDRQALDLDAEYPTALTARARAQGLSEQTAKDYWAAHWELPSYTQATQMLFRGFIDRPKFQRLLKALDYAPTWRAPLEGIARAIPTMSDFIRFAQREVFSPQQRQALGLDADYPAAFTAKAALHGMSEQDAKDYWAAHWRLPSARQGYTMLWRGLINEGQLDGLLKALDYPAVWRDRLAAIARVVPGRIDLKRMFRLGVLNRAQVKAGYQRLGYSAADAELMTQIAEAELASGGAGQKWADRARSRLFTVAHDEYLDASITPQRVGQVLSQLGVAQAERAEVLRLWNTERDITRLELTPKQIVKAWKEDEYTRARAVAELVERGMTEEDANVLLDSD